MTDSIVRIRKTSPTTLVEDVAKILNESDFSRWQLNSTTYIKMNGNYDRHYPGSNTSPWFMDALLAGLRQGGFDNLIVVEGNLPYFTADQMIRRTGMLDILKKYDVDFVNYENMERDESNIPRMLLDKQIINLPVPHGHGFAVMSCAVKNLFGLLPNPRRKYHRTLSDTILKLEEKVKPFTIVDATVGLIGPSTRRGTPMKMDLILAGWDCVNLDVVMTKMMGYEVKNIPHLKLALQRGRIPEFDIQGDFTWETLPKFNWPLDIDTSRRVANWLESTWVEDLWLFQVVENWLERIYHHLTFLRNRKKLFNGPWMQYEQQMKNKNI